jgi:hypothetical protein
MIHSVHPVFTTMNLSVHTPTPSLGLFLLLPHGGCNACAVWHQGSRHHHFAIMCAEGYGVGFDTLSLFGWFGSTSLGAFCMPHPRPCPHAPDGVTLERSPWDATPTYPCVCPGGGRPVTSTIHVTPIITTNKQVRAPAMTLGPPEVPSKGRGRR